MKILNTRYGPVITIGALTVGAIFAFSVLFDPVSDDSEPGATFNLCRGTAESEVTVICTGLPVKLAFADPDETLVLTFDDTSVESNISSNAGVDTDTDFVDPSFADIDADTADKFAESETYIKEEYNAFLRKHGCDTSKPDSEGCRILYEKSNLLVKGLTGVIGKHADTEKGIFAGTSGAKEKPLLKAGFDPALLGCCFAVMAFVAWWQKRRALQGDMVMCASTDVGAMVLPPPIIFGFSMRASTVVRKRALQEAAPQPAPLRVVNSATDEDVAEDTDTDEDDFELEVMECQVPFRNSRYKIYVGMFADLAHNPAILARLYEKSLRMHRRDSDLIKKAYKETINLN